MAMHRIILGRKQLALRQSLTSFVRKGTASAVPITSSGVERAVTGIYSSRLFPPRGAVLCMGGGTAADRASISKFRAEESSVFMQTALAALGFFSRLCGTAKAVPFRKKTTKQIWTQWVVVQKTFAFISLFIASVVSAQSMDVGQSATPKTKGGHVQFVAEPQTIIAGNSATVLLHFKVDPGFHINSHTPKSEMLIPTKIAVEETPDLNVKAVDFPHGTPYSFSFEPKEKLDVYTGDFTLTAHVTTKPGAHSIKAALHYQACDAAACYPPKLLPVEQPFMAR